MSTQTTALPHIYAPIQDDLHEVARVFDREIQSEFEFVNELCATVRSYRGKMLRPALLLLCAKAAGRVTREHHVLGAVIELVHMATLVHDDVLDGALQRRRKPTICALSGNVAAVLLGDFLISHAFHLCSSLNDQFASRRIGATTNTVCEGELLQNTHMGDINLSEATYLAIIERKTAALTGTACELGAHYAGANAETVSSLKDYGLSSGVAFQIIDDVLDILGDADEVGKTLGSDLRLGKQTLPTIHARSKSSSAVEFDSRRWDDPDRLRDVLAATGSIEYAVEAATQHVNDAVQRLEVLAPSESKAALTELAEFIVRRSF